MKTFSLTLLAAIFLTLPASHLNSQAVAPRDPATLLIELKKKNDALLERQAATLKALEEMEAEAGQIRILTKRG